LREHRGNLTGDGTATYVWNARNELVSRTADSGTYTYRYDSMRRRSARTAGGVTTGYLYDGVNAVQEKASGSVAASMLTGGVDEVFSRTTSDGSLSLLRDRLGSTIAGASGSAVDAEYTYAPFGATTVTGNDLGNPSRFTGREDEGDGLYYYRARYYSATQQRFLSRDPIGLASGDTNPYAYVVNQPTGLTDPMGTKPKGPGHCGGFSLPEEDPDGLEWVDEGADLRNGWPEGENLRDFLYEAGATGARSNVLTGRRSVPRLSFPDAVSWDPVYVKFDSYDASTRTLIDRKGGVTKFPNTVHEAYRQSMAAAHNGFHVRWEVATETAKKRAEYIFKRWGIVNIDIKVVPEGSWKTSC
jgi:RHS repeat-associated protein